MNLLRSASTFSAMTLVSRLLGLARDIVLSRSFGASAATDAFFVAFKIPNFLRRLFAEGSFSLAFVPVLAEYRARDDKSELKSLIDATTGCLLAVLLVLTGLGVLAAPWVVAAFAPGFADQPEQQQLAASLLRITFPYLPLIALTALAGGILNTLGRFAVPALTPALLNICLIAAAVLFAPQFAEPIEALAWGVLAAGVVQLAVQVPVLARHGVLPRPWPDFSHPGVRRILKLMLPTLFGSSVAQINLMLDVLIASLLIEASISWLYYGDRLMEFPLGLFGVALSVVVLPTLASQHARADRVEFRATLDWALRLGVLIALPAATGLALLAEPIVATLFHYGRFAAEDVQMAALALACYCAGLPAFIGVKILAPAFYARQDTMTPVRIGIIALSANMVLNIVFVLSIAGTLAGGFDAGIRATLAAHPGVHAGLALASAASAWLNAALLWRNLRARDDAAGLPWRVIGQSAFGCALMAIVLLMLSPATSGWLEQGLAGRIGWLTGLVGLGALVYAATLLALGRRPRELIHRVQTRDGG
ncbi:MAG: murein biosynthesis integral membrane protein MurJ [Wenzhouxiangellaceae bacterium]|nr:murein biosynthesis integral membrane protein MurJ [Wenzhouxiangellaceae bacterium]